MGTNYYYHEDSVCGACGHSKADDEEGLHIGKSSAGWVFKLHIYPQDGVSSLNNWADYFERSRSIIKNEYGDTISPFEMLRIITCRAGPESLQYGTRNILPTYEYVTHDFS